MACFDLMITVVRLALFGLCASPSWLLKGRWGGCLSCVRLFALLVSSQLLYQEHFQVCSHAPQTHVLWSHSRCRLTSDTF